MTVFLVVLAIVLVMLLFIKIKSRKKKDQGEEVREPKSLLKFMGDVVMGSGEEAAKKCPYSAGERVFFPVKVCRIGMVMRPGVIRFTKGKRAFINPLGAPTKKLVRRRLYLLRDIKGVQRVPTPGKVKKISPEEFVISDSTRPMTAGEMIALEDRLKLAAGYGSVGVEATENLDVIEPIVN